MKGQGKTLEPEVYIKHIQNSILNNIKSAIQGLQRISCSLYNQKNPDSTTFQGKNTRQATQVLRILQIDCN